jgi:hypothetical protein
MAPPVELPMTSLMVLPLKNSCELAYAVPAIKAKANRKQIAFFISPPDELSMKAENANEKT